MPVRAVVGMQLGNDDEMTETRWDVLVTSGTEIGLAGLIRLDALHDDGVDVERRIVTIGRRHDWPGYRGGRP